MKKSEEQSIENDAHAKKLPAEIVGRFLQNLSVRDRLQGERVSPLWKRALSKLGWTEQKKLDVDIVFEGANQENIVRFWGNLDICHLASLLCGCVPRLSELDLRSFGGENVGRFLPQITESFQSLNKIEKLDIRGLNLRDFVNHLSPNLGVLKTSGGIYIETLQTLAHHCPNLEEVPFENVYGKNNLETKTIIKLIGKFPRQKKLNLFDFPLPRPPFVGRLASFGRLKELVVLDLLHCECLDERSLEAIVEGCQHLRSLSLRTSRLTEGDLFQLAKMPNLTALHMEDEGGCLFSDAVLKAIAERGQLKKLVLALFITFYDIDEKPLSDDSIVYLVDRCKTLVSLEFEECPHITERSLEAIVAEVKRRHGSPPRTLPRGPLDPGIFHLNLIDTGIEWRRAVELYGDNPWLSFDEDPREIF